jgi:hypothetical protein
MKIFVTTCDRYANTLRPFAYLFNKYFSAQQEVFVCGFDYLPNDLPKNFRLHSLGKQADYPVGKWSNGFLKLMLDFPRDEVFLLLFEDYFLTCPVNLDAITILENYMWQFRYVLKIDLFTDRRFAAGAAPYGHAGFVPLVKSDPESQYHMSLMAGLWNRTRLNEVLIPDESPWEVELEGTTRLRQFGDNVLVIGTDSWDDDPKTCPLTHTLAHRSGNSNKFFLDELNPEDRAIVETMI